MDGKYGQIAEGTNVNAAIYKCFGHIAEEDARKFVKKFRDQPHESVQIMQTFRELVFGAFLCQEGLNARYDMSVDGQTPDWTVMSPEPEGIVEMVNFQIDQPTAVEIEAARATTGMWSGWRGSNAERLYQSLWKKAGTYRTLRQKLVIPYAIGLFGSFEANVFEDEIEECVGHKEHGLFGMYTDLSGLLYFEERGGSYVFRYFPSLSTERAWQLPSGVINLRP